MLRIGFQTSCVKFRVCKLTSRVCNFAVFFRRKIGILHKRIRVAPEKPVTPPACRISQGERFGGRDVTDTSKTTTKLECLKRFVANGELREAVLLAAKFQQLGTARNAILSAREAYLRPEFQKQLGRDPQALIDAGVAALRGRYNV